MTSPNVTMVALILLSFAIGVILTVVLMKISASLGACLNKRYGKAIKQWCWHHKLPIFKQAHYIKEKMTEQPKTNDTSKRDYASG